MNQQQDRFTLYYSAWFVLFFLLLMSSTELDRVFDIGILCALTLVMFLVSGVLYWPAALARHLWYRQWRRVISLTIIPVIAIGLLTGLTRAGIDATWVRLQFRKHEFVADIARLPQGELRQIAWDWGSDGLWIFDVTASWIVYDEGDFLGDQDAQKTTAWRQRTLAAIGAYAPDETDLWVKQVDGHFYLVELAEY